MRVMTTVTMPNTDWMRVIAAVGTVHAYHVRKGDAKEADEMELVGRQIVVVNNLPEVVLRGEESRGMLLAASDESGIILLGPDRPCKPGAGVK